MTAIIFPTALNLTDPANLPQTGKGVGLLQGSLSRLKFKLDGSDVARKEMGVSTIAAIKNFQAKAGLAADGKITAATVAKLNSEIAHDYISKNKQRTQHLQAMLVQAGHVIDRVEIDKRSFGPATEKALGDFQHSQGMPRDGRASAKVVGKLTEVSLAEKLKSQTQRRQLQRTLLRALNIAKLGEVRIDSVELQKNEIGPSTQSAIKTLQAKYGLKVTGQIDSMTYERLASIATSVPEPVRIFKPRNAAELVPIRKVGKLNMAHDEVSHIQGVLAFLGQKINELEYRSKQFGQSTRAAVVQFQQSRNLPATGHVSGATLKALNREIKNVNPGAAAAQFPYRVRGSVRNETWVGMANVTVQIWEKLPAGLGAKLAERKTGPNGFYDVVYEPPREATTKTVKRGYQLQITFLDAAGTQIGSKMLLNPTQIAWTNFTQGKYPYLGASEFSLHMAAVKKVIGAIGVATLKESAADRQISRAANAAEISDDELMRLVLSHLVATRIGQANLSAEACYGFIAQGLPSSLPEDLIGATVDWTVIDNLVELAANGLVFMEDALADSGFENAINLNLITIAIGLAKKDVLSTLAELKKQYVLEKPILIGNGNLKELLQESKVPAAQFSEVATTFLRHKSFSGGFWKDAEARPVEFGGSEALKDLRTIIEIGHVTKNFKPMFSMLKAKFDDPNDTSMNAPRDLAKLSTDDWVSLITANAGQLPPNTDGVDAAAQIANYAATLSTQAERMFPAVALVATVARNNNTPLANLKEVAGLLDSNPDFNLKTDNLDTLIHTNNLVVDAKVLGEARVLQRVQRLTPNAAAGEVLLANNIHNSAQIVTMGKNRFVETFSKGRVEDQRLARTVYALAEHQYAEVLQRITEYRFDMHKSDPRAIINYSYGAGELPAIPDLATLFGSLDFCSCDHCQSVYGPAAYLTDMLRFLDEHPSEIANKTVRDLLFERRPDIGNIKLNCQNTDTALPYIDLVNEVLENAVAAPNPLTNFSLQTTTEPAELRAAPQHVRVEAYEKLRTAEFPMALGFDLWQEQARVFLNHLGIARHGLMKIFQLGAAGPSDANIAGEYWGLSSKEAALITAQVDATAARQKIFWGITDANLPGRLAVADFMRRAQLDYAALLELLYVQWINPEGDANNVVVERPGGTCDTDLQQVAKLDVARLDKIHRFRRLLAHTPFSAWELDLLIRDPAVGNGILDGNCLVQLMQFDVLRKRLGLATDKALALFGDLFSINLKKPEHPNEAIPSLYDRLFLNRAITNPVDAAFALPIAAGLAISDLDPTKDHRRSILAAFELAAADLDLLLTILPDTNLTVANLSKLARYVGLAKGLGFSIDRLLKLEALSGAANLFASPKSVLDFIATADAVAQSSFTISQLDYLLRVNLTSSLGLRDETVTQHVEGLRLALQADAGKNPDGTMFSHLAATINVTPEQARIFSEAAKRAGKTFSEILLDSKLTEVDAAGQFKTAVSAIAFPNIYAAFKMLHKAAMVMTQLGLDAVTLQWLMAKASNFGLLELQVLPLDAAPAQPLLGAFLALSDWVQFKDRYPEPEAATLTGVFDLAAKPATTLDDVAAMFAQLTQFDLGSVKQAIGGLGLQQVAVPSDFSQIAQLQRLETSLKLAARLGVSPNACANWAKREDAGLQALTAQEARQAAKAKYDNVVWLEKVRPLEDQLREAKRRALVAYLVGSSLMSENPRVSFAGKTYPNPAYWTDSNDLLKYYLIDVEMGACQLTSRIKQAISSVQMFVQRCLLGLEQPRVEVSRAAQQDSVSDNSWRQWRWMKNYRVWEANRKVFLYPENWIEPELRTDKSPFFKELESELLQSDITEENANAAFVNYVQKVHDVARLDIVGTYYELDDTDPRDNLPPDINQLHVVGRTRAQPAVHYYRRFDLNYLEWSAWEKIDVEILGDHMVPVVYNRRLYLFWLNFIEKPQKVQKVPPAKATSPDSAGNVNSTTSPEPPIMFEIELCWSAQKDGGWTAKKVSKQKLVHPWQRPRDSYNLKPRYKQRENMLWLDIYVSQSREFNSGKFWDPYRNVMAAVTAKSPFAETARPWHSSSFLFDGEVVDVKMKALAGQYHVMRADGTANENLVATTSLNYVQTSFGEKGRTISRLSGAYEIAPRLPLPDGMHYRNTKLTNNTQYANPSSANVLENGNTRSLMTGAKSPFEIVASQHSIVFDTAAWGPVPLIYQDNQRAFFIKPEWLDVIVGYNQTLQSYNYVFHPFYHPYSALMLREVKRSGVEGLLTRRLQMAPGTYYPGNTFNFASYAPTSISKADTTAQHDVMDFARSGAYALYNWEIFFHAPLMIACKLMQNQRFEEAMHWFHYIFDPTNTETVDVPQRYWVTKPFFEQNSEAYRKQRIDNLLNNINAHEGELRAWKNNPFQPHLIARYRPIAYQKTVVMKYIDNLVAWGDQLFKRDTIESINEATTLYVLAYELLGRRPVKVPNVEHKDMSYNELEATPGGIDSFGNSRIEVLMENFTQTPVRITRTATGSEPLPRLSVFYFGIPNNDRLLDYWDTVEDRLFKIRNCMNIQGVVRQLPMFEPPIDPALLVKAAAAGVDLGSVLSDLAVAPAPYRTLVLAQKASEFCGSLNTLGDKLLAALEKNDAEGLALLRTSQEIALLKATSAIKKKQIEEANHNWASLEKALEMAQQKQAYYSNREFMNALETVSAALASGSILVSGILSLNEFLAAGFHFGPSFNIGIAGFGASPTVTVQWGTENIARGMGAVNSGIQHIGSALSQGASLVSTIAGYERRSDDWKFQADLAGTEIVQVNKQIAAAQIRVAITEKELENHDLQIEHSQAVDDYMRSKYTSQQLLDWQIRQISAVYFQAYQLAYDMAKRAEKSFQLERGEPKASFIQFGHWDSLKKGLLAGERLANDLARLEAAYLTQNARELEITKHVSLAQLSPLSLLALKENGSCNVVLPEWLFDLDYPGHYRRRIKSVSISLPSVVGPYTGVNCTLSLVNHGIRMIDSVAGGFGDPLAPADERFFKSVVPQTAIVTSHGNNDAGLFELNLGDDRFLPFEGAGAVSEWRIDLPRDCNQFDLSTIPDVIFHINYVARASNTVALATAAKANLAAKLPQSTARLFMLKHEFSDAWHRFLHPVGNADQVFDITLTREHLPFFLRGKKTITLSKLDLVIEGGVDNAGAGLRYVVNITPPGGPALPDNPLNPDPSYGGRQSASKAGFAPNAALLGSWSFTIKRDTSADFKSLSPEEIRNANLVLAFSAK